MSVERKSTGQINYEDYARMRREQGETMAQWTWLESEERIAWDAGAQAVAKSVLPKNVFDEHSTVKVSREAHEKMLDNLDAKLEAEA